MESPPPYMPAPKKSNTGLIIGLIIGGVFLCCVLPIGLMGGGAFWVFNKAKGIVQCGMAFQNVKNGVLKYAAAHDGKLPKAETWQDDVKRYYAESMTPKDQAGPFEQMSPDGDWGCKESDGTMTGIAFNSDLSGKKLDSIKDQLGTVLLFETERASHNLHEKYKPRPFETSPMMLGKHRGWLKSSVSGQNVLTDKNGREVPFNTTMNGSGVTVNVNNSAGSGN